MFYLRDCSEAKEDASWTVTLNIIRLQFQTKNHKRNLMLFVLFMLD